MIDWNAIASWVEAVGTLGAFTVALSIALGQRRHARILAERSQASLVNAWLDIGSREGKQCVRLLARNSSQSQVNDFKGTVVDTLTPGSC